LAPRGMTNKLMRGLELWQQEAGQTLRFIEPMREKANTGAKVSPWQARQTRRSR
jgi:hypothetical protein